jgi:hypothetical protein
MQILGQILSQAKSGPGIVRCLVLILFVLPGCVSRVPDLEQRLALAQHQAQAVQGGEQVIFDSRPFDLFGFQPVELRCRGQKVHIYIEGDGLAWLTRSIISDDPTPLNPLALKLWAQDPHLCKVYLARPCQYISGPGCSKPLWTNGRFSREVIQSYHGVLDQISQRFAPASFVLFGYSGGGAVAAILAAERRDISKLVTVAGNLDTAFWVSKHRMFPLTGSLNPADFASSLEQVEQYHFIGSRDTNIDPSIFFSFAEKFANREKLHYKIWNLFDHVCCWEDVWQTILEQIGEK